MTAKQMLNTFPTYLVRTLWQLLDHGVAECDRQHNSGAFHRQEARLKWAKRAADGCRDDPPTQSGEYGSIDHWNCRRHCSADYPHWEQSWRQVFARETDELVRGHVRRTTTVYAHLHRSCIVARLGQSTDGEGLYASLPFGKVEYEAVPTSILGLQVFEVC